MILLLCTCKELCMFQSASMYTFFGFSQPCENDKTTFLLLFSISMQKQIQVNKGNECAIHLTHFLKLKLL